jgi:hypothetical protein
MRGRVRVDQTRPPLIWPLESGPAVAMMANARTRPPHTPIHTHTRTRLPNQPTNQHDALCWLVGRSGGLAGWLVVAGGCVGLAAARAKVIPHNSPFCSFARASFLFIHYQPRCVCMHACVRACVHRQRWCGPVNNNNRLAFNLLLPKKIKTHVRAPKRDLIRALCCCLASCFGLLSLSIYIYMIYIIII